MREWKDVLKKRKGKRTMRFNNDLNFNHLSHKNSFLKYTTVYNMLHISRILN